MYPNPVNIEIDLFVCAAPQDLGPSGTVKLQRVHMPRPKATSCSDALAALMDFPHPLEILGEPNSYGPDGAISRYHNPDNYTRALGGIVNARTRDWRASFAQSTGSPSTATANNAAAELSAANEDAGSSTASHDASPSSLPQQGNGEPEDVSDSSVSNFMDVTSSLDVQMADDGFCANGAVNDSHGNQDGSTTRRGFPMGMHWMPWFKKLQEEEGTATIRVRKPSNEKQSDLGTHLGDAAGSPVTAKSTVQKGAKLPELHRIHVPWS